MTGRRRLSPVAGLGNGHYVTQLAFRRYSDAVISFGVFFFQVHFRVVFVRGISLSSVNSTLDFLQFWCVVFSGTL
jgi:hypothetical protein